MNRILIRDLYRITGGDTFELTIKKRKLVEHKNGKSILLTILVNKQVYEIWEPKNKVWQRFRTQTGRGLLAKVEHYDDRYFMKPLEQLLVIDDARDVVDLYDLPLDDGDYIVGIGVVSSQNKTQYLYMLIDENTRRLIRIPSGWEGILDTLQYRVVDVTYKRTAKKGFLSFNEVVSELEEGMIDRLFSNL